MMQVTVLKDGGKKPWSFNGKSGESRRIVVRTQENDIISFKCDPELDFSTLLDQKVNLHVIFRAGQNMEAEPKVVGYDE